jgi:hypothetical protein
MTRSRILPWLALSLFAAPAIVFNLLGWFDALELYGIFFGICIVIPGLIMLTFDMCGVRKAMGLENVR